MRRAPLFVVLCAMVTCGSAPPLPPCPRPTGSVYKPGEAPVATAAPAPTKEAPPEAAPPPKPKFTRQSYRPAPRAPQSTGPVAACGDKKTPCPLQRWMREKMAPALAKMDGPALAAALDAVAKTSPMPGWEWKAMAANAAAAARTGDVAEARKSCQGCHNAFKVAYKEKYRTRAAPMSP